MTSTPLTSLSMAILIYAESLLNIRQVTVCISLPSETTKQTKLELSSAGEKLAIYHVGQTSSIRLPTLVKPTTSLELPKHDTKEFTIRLPIANGAVSRTQSSPSTASAWSPDALAETSDLLCSACQAILIDASRIQQWKALPNENWAEMMELWHCHKPDIPNGTQEDASQLNKGYGAANRLIAQTGVGLVGVSSALFATEDCNGVKVGLYLLFLLFDMLS